MSACTCLPKIISYLSSDGSSCIMCKNVLPDNADNHVFYCVLSYCRCKSTTVKRHLLALCAECVPTFKKYIEDRKLDNYFDFISMSTFLNTNYIELVDKFINRVKYTSEMCANCSLYEVQNLKFKVCGKCKMTRYCSSKCQKKHWKAHKRYCAEKSKNLKIAKQFKIVPKGISDKNLVPTCKCLTNPFKEVLHALNHSKCCHPSCTKIVVPPYEFMFLRYSCRIDNQDVHRIPLMHCSSKCRKHHYAMWKEAKDRT